MSGYTFFINNLKDIKDYVYIVNEFAPKKWIFGSGGLAKLNIDF